MANAQSTIDLIFNGVDRASEVAKKVSNSLGDLSGSAQSISQPFSDMADRLAVVQAAMAALAGVIGTVAFNESAKFESSLLSLQKQMEANEGSAQQYVGQLRELALRYGENGNVLVESAADFKAAGNDIDTSIKLVKAAMDLAIAGGIETARATDLMNSSLAGFDVPASEVVKEATHIGDVLNKTADITKSSFSELAEGFAKLSPTAKLAGLTAEETAAILSKVVDVFRSGSEAANGLKSGFLSLIDPSKEAAAKMNELGVNYKNADGSLRSVNDILKAMGPVFQGLTKEQQLNAAAIIFGKDQADKMVLVLSRWNSAMELSARVAAEAGGSIEKEVGGKLALAETAVKRADEAFRQLAETLGNQFRDSTTGVINSVSELAIAFRDVVESGKLDPLFKALQGNLGDLDALFKTIAKNLPAAFDGVNFDKLLAALADLKEEGAAALEALFGPVDLSTVEGLRAAMQKIVDLVTGLTKATAGELGGLAPLLKGIRELATGFTTADGSTQKFIGQLLGLGKSVNEASGFFDGINTALLTFIAFGPKLAAFGREALVVAGAMTGPAGIAVALGLLTAEIIKFLGYQDELTDWTWPDWLAGYEGASAGTAAADIADGFAALAERIKGWLPHQKEADGLLSTRVPVGRYDGVLAEINKYDNQLQENIRNYEHYFDIAKTPVPVTSFDGMISRLDELAGVTNKAKAATIEWTDSLKKFESELPGGVKKTTDAFTASGKAADGLGGSLGGLSTKYEQASNAAVRATGAFAGPGDAAQKQAEQIDEAIKKSQEYKQKMEELASNERIKTIEAVVSLKAEGLKQDAERVKATFASINESIKSTGELIGSLFGQLKGADSFTQSKIYSQIADENRRREEALQLQKKLAEAEIDRVRAQTDALNRGDAAIKIEAGGLEPELEAFMWAILKKIRISANEQFREYLLGLNPVT